MRFISHGALVTFVAVAAIFLTVALVGQPPFWLAFLLLAINIGAFALVPANFNASAIVGYAFNGTLVPIATAFTLYGSIATAIVLWTERGRLFTRHPV